MLVGLYPGSAAAYSLLAEVELADGSPSAAVYQAIAGTISSDAAAVSSRHREFNVNRRNVIPIATTQWRR